MTGLTFPEAIIIGLLQGITELFPVSSLGHSVIIPALIGGSWGRDLNVSAPESPYLAFVVGLHVATAAALLLVFRRDWVRIIGGLVSSVRHRRILSDGERLAWLIVIATIPVGIAGLLLEHLFRTVLGRPQPAAAFLIANGLVLLLGERLRKQASARTAIPAAPRGTGRRADHGADEDPDAGLTTIEGDDHSDSRLARLPLTRGLFIGAAQILALLPGISRSGAAMVAGLVTGLNHRDAARFSFLLATPVILAAGLLKVPDLFGPLGDGIRGQVLAGSAASFVGAYLAVRFLDRYFRTRTLTPFAWYCMVAGAAALIVLTVR